MSSAQTADVVESLVSTEDTKVLDGENFSLNLVNLEMSTGAAPSPKDRGRSSEPHTPKSTAKSPTSKNDGTPRALTTRSAISKPSSIPVKMQKSSASKIPSNISVLRMNRLSRPSSATLKSLSTVTNKHTLEIQFINKKKRLTILRKELTEKQKPVLDLYQNLIQIKKRLEELGKIVYLEDMKLMSYNEQAEFSPESGGDGTEGFSADVLNTMQNSIEEIPKTLMTICKNLLGRRTVIVELLESIVKSEVDVADLRDQIETLKTEGVQLQSNLDVVIKEHAEKIKEIVRNWQKLLNEKTTIGKSAKVEQLQEQLKSQEKLTEESKTVIQDLQRKLEDKRGGHEKYVGDLNNMIHALKEQILKLEVELENEKKVANDYRNRNTANAQNSKHLRSKIAELESDKKATETANNDLTKKLKLVQEQLKTKETQWTKDKEELTKNLKHQENLLQKLNADKTSFETRLEAVEGERTTLEEQLQNTIDDLTLELNDIKVAFEEVSKERDEAIAKQHDMEEHITKMGLLNKEAMDAVSKSIEWGTDVPMPVDGAQTYAQLMVRDIIIQEKTDKVKTLEEENECYRRNLALVQSDKSDCKSETEKIVDKQHATISKYKELLSESEQKLIEKSTEVSKLTAEIRQLKVRQEHLEELNEKCPTDNLQEMVEEGRSKLNDLMNKSMETEQKLLHYETIIERQTKQLNEMENLLRFRENIAGILKASRDEVILEKESLTKYSHEMRSVLSELTKESKMKDRLIKELQEKIDKRDRQLNKLEKENRDLEQNLMLTNEKRFKLQETIGTMEKELQSTKAHVNQLADINTRYEIDMECSNSKKFQKHRCLKSSSSTQCDLNEKFCSKHGTTNGQQNECNSSTNDDSIERKKLNSKSLIGLSLKQVDFLKTRLNYLSNISPVKSGESIGFSFKTSSNQSISNQISTKSKLDRMMELITKRYEYQQKQANQTYDELTGLMKLALSNSRLTEHKNQHVMTKNKE